MDNKLTASQLDTNTRPLTAKETAFKDNYGNPGSDTYNNGTQSAIKAGFKPKGARVQACRLLTKPNIIKALEDIKAETKAELDVTVAEIVSNARWQIEYGKAKGDSQALARGNDQLGRIIGAYTDNIKNTGDGLQLNFNTKAYPRAADKDTA